MAAIGDHRNSEWARFLRFPAFGIYTRFTATGSQLRIVWCTCTARSVLAGEVSATSPSIPAVLRPALRCVACRTDTNVFDRDRSINFCRFLTFGQSPFRVAVKIRCRSRRTLSSWWRQLMASQSGIRSVHSGPPSHRSWSCVQLALRFRRIGLFVLTDSPASRQPAHAAGTRPGIRPVMRDNQRRSRSHRLGFLSPFGHRHSLLGHPVPPGVRPPLLSAYRPASARRTTTRFPCSARVRRGWAWVLSLPRGRRCSRGHHTSMTAACRFSSASPYSPRRAIRPGKYA